MRRKSLSTGTFVFAVVGDEHVARLATPLKFLRRFSRSEILVVQSRSNLRAPHENTAVVSLPEALDDHQASLFLKTNLLRYLYGRSGIFCYLDSDVVAVRDDVDSIFDAFDGSVRFAADHVDIDAFSRWAVRCGCERGRCNHLRAELRRLFDVDVPNGGWRLWNGGVFLFDARSQSFFETWHAFTLQIFDDPRWRTRDQGTLVATAWRLGLATRQPLDPRFNFIVDRMDGIPPARRATATVADCRVRDDYALYDEPGRAHPRLIHFINGGVDQSGWRNWDDVAALLP